ncbi:MAG: hypothetical protein Q9224_005661 [Gallowayella concinna]
MPTPPGVQKRKKFKKAQKECSETPRPKRQRTMRSSISGKTMRYDMKYHPMDDVMRPSAAAARKAAHGLDSPHSSTKSELTLVNTSDESDEDDKDAGPKQALRASPPRHPIRLRTGSPSNRRITRGEAYGEKPALYDMKYHPMDHILQYNASRTPPQPKSSLKKSIPPIHRPVRPRSSSPSTRRVTRGEVHGEKPVQYNMKHHPMDEVMRPYAAKKVRAKSTTVPDGPPSTVTSESSKTLKDLRSKPQEALISDPNPTALSATSPVSTTLSKLPASSLWTPATSGQLTKDPVQDVISSPDTRVWKLLKDADRLVYSLQKGAPPSSSTMPLGWHEVARAVKREYRVPETVKNAVELEQRYREMYKLLQDYYGALLEPAVKQDWVLHHAEDFDIYDCKVGENYWTHRKDKVVQPLQIPDPCQNLDQQKQSVRDELRHKVDQLAELGHWKNCHVVQHPPARDIDIGKNTARPLEQSTRTTSRSEDTAQPQPSAKSSHRNSSGFHGDEGYCGREDSFNDAEGYIRQAEGRHKDSQTQENPEDEILTSLRNQVSASIDDILEPDEIGQMFPLTADSADHTKSKKDVGLLSSGSLKQRSTAETSLAKADEELEREDEIRLPLIHHHINGSTTAKRGFVVHEDQPGNTPKIKRQVALHPKSPGTDLPKENWEQSSSWSR